MPRVRLAWHRAQLRIPLAGDLLRKQAIVRLSVVLSTLLRSGVVFVRALQIARQADAEPRAERTRCNGARKRSPPGGTSAARWRRPARSRRWWCRCVSVGQQSGRLEEMLDRLAADYDRQVATAAQRLTALLEPALILVLVVIVGFIVLATILPMLEAANAF